MALVSDDEKRKAVELFAAAANFQLGKNRPRVAQIAAADLVGRSAVSALSRREWGRLASQARAWARLAWFAKTNNREWLGGKDLPAQSAVRPRRKVGRPKKVLARTFSYVLRDKSLVQRRLEGYAAEQAMDPQDLEDARKAVEALITWRQNPDNAERRPTTLNGWLKLGAALATDPTASFKGTAANGDPLYFYERFGLCGRSGCDRFFFRRGRGELRPKFCSTACKKRVNEQGRYGATEKHLQAVARKRKNRKDMKAKREIENERRKQRAAR